jgi:hypothetical protein
VIIFYEDRFSGKSKEDPMTHLNEFKATCKTLKMSNANNNLIKVKLFPYSRAGKALDWVLKWLN